MLPEKFNIDIKTFNNLENNSELFHELTKLRDECNKKLKEFSIVMPNMYKLKKNGSIWKRNGVPVINRSVN